jgi:DNA adenine methylase
MISMDASFHSVATSQVINVASVPHRSPFRYPGGKTWLVPYIRLWLQSTNKPLLELFEPFAGGGIVGLTAAFEGLADKVTLVELDSDVSSVWESILNGNAEWLAEEIVNFKVTPQSVRRVLSLHPRTVRQRAFATILRNRVQRGGILAKGAGLMNQGENGKGLTSRWYPETLRRRILEIVNIRERFKFVHGDGVKCIEKNLRRKGVAFFVDPPYSIAGRRLYAHSVIDHRAIFSLMSKAVGDFLLTYDDSDEIRRLVVEYRFDCETVAMKNTHNSRMDELLIGKNLSWLRASDLSKKVSLEFEIRTPPGSPDDHLLALQRRVRAL